MYGLNEFLIIGGFTKDPELTYLPSGTAVCKATIAWSKPYKTKDGKEGETKLFIPSVFWGRQAEIVVEYKKKGGLICAKGQLQTDSWKNESGETRSMIKFNVEDVTLLPDRQKKEAETEEVAE